MRRPFRFAAVLGAALTLSGGLTAPAAVLAAGPITVTTTADTLAADGACSLREAIRAANLDQPVDACRAGSGSDRVVLPAGAYVLAVAGTDEDAALQGDLDITSDLTITGEGRDTTIIDGAGLDRVLDIFAPASVAIRDVTVMGGLTPESGARPDGGGIENGGTLRLTRVAITENTSFAAGGGIHNSGRLVMVDSTVARNSTGGGSGGSAGIASPGDVWLAGVEISANRSSGIGGPRPGRGDPGDAAGLDVDGTLVMTRSVISGNNGGAEWTTGGVAVHRGLILETTIDGNSGTSCGAGGIAMVDTLMVASTVSGNRGGDCAGAGGVIAFDSRIIESTISGNSLEGGSGFGQTGGILTSGTTIVASTIAANVNNSQGGMGIASGLVADTDVPTTLVATILAGNVDGDGNPADCAGPVASGGNNLIGSTSGCTFASTATDLVGIDPLLGPLADNGGPTLTHALLAGSPAIDAFVCEARDRSPACFLAFDQRGVRRPLDGNGDHVKRYDIGAVEMVRPR